MGPGVVSSRADGDSPCRSWAEAGPAADSKGATVMGAAAGLGPPNVKIQIMYQWMATGFDIGEGLGNGDIKFQGLLNIP